MRLFANFKQLQVDLTTSVRTEVLFSSWNWNHAYILKMQPCSFVLRKTCSAVTASHPCEQRQCIKNPKTQSRRNDQGRKRRRTGAWICLGATPPSMHSKIFFLFERFSSPPSSGPQWLHRGLHTNTLPHTKIVVANCLQKENRLTSSTE